MIRSIALGAALSLAPTLGAQADMISKQSPHSVAQTVDRLAAAVEGAGAKVFARIDHAAGASSIGADLRPTQMLMFGNPKLGTPVMAMNQTAGIDLPMRVVVYEDAKGDVMLSYYEPTTLAGFNGISADAEILKKMAGALGKLTDKAIAQ